MLPSRCASPIGEAVRAAREELGIGEPASNLDDAHLSVLSYRGDVQRPARGRGGAFR
jgi:hypothetical protein